MKSLKKLFMAGVFAAMAAFCLAPGLAFADEGGVNLTQEDFNNSDGLYVISKAGTYNLTEDVAGSIKVTATSDSIQINLNGHSLTNENANNYALFMLASYVTVTVDGKDPNTGELGSIVQNAENKKAAIRLDTEYAPTYCLKNLEVKSKSTECIDSQKATTTLENVSLSTSGEANSLIYNKSADLTIISGTFVKSASTHEMFQIETEGVETVKPIVVNGGVFNEFPKGVKLGDGVDLYKESSGSYKVVSSSDVPKQCWSVTLDDQDQLVYKGDTKDIYFESESEAQAFVTASGKSYEVKEVDNRVDLSNATVTLDPDTCIYDGNEKQPEATVVVDGKTLTKGTDYELSYKSNTEAGTATATIEGINDCKGSTSKTFTISPLSLEGATVTLGDPLTYNGKPQTQGIASVKAKSGEKDVDVSFEYLTVTGNTATDAGDNYTMTLTANEGTNFTGSVECSYSIAKAEANIKVNAPADKTVGDPAFNLNATRDTDSALEYDSSDKDVATVDGNGQVTIHAAGTTILTVSAEEVGNYKQGEASVELKVKEKAPEVNIAKAKVTLSKTAFTYNGKTQKPSVKSVILNGKTLKAGTDYTASIASGKKVGTYSVAIAAKGSYTGKATASFTVNPKGVTKFKVTKAKKSFKAKWKKSKTERSGVQVKYSTKKSMKNAKTVKAKGASVKAKKVKKLKKKTKYYVQVRAYKTVGGKTYYSGWSAKKAVKTK